MKELKPLLCRQCGSHDIRQEKGRYVCNYCGTGHYDAGARMLLESAVALFRNNTRIAAVSVTVAVVIVAGSVAFIVNRQGPTTGKPDVVAGIPAEKPEKPVEAGKDAIEPEKKVSADFSDISPLPDSIGNIYFVGMFRNTGETPVYPRAEIALYDARGEKVAVARGYGIRSYILPGEKTPVSVLVQRAPAYKTVRSIGVPESPGYYPERPRLSFSKLKMNSPAHRFDYHRVTGRVKNGSGKDARYVQVAVTAFDSSGRIIGYAGNFLGQTVLRTGEEAPFSVDFHLMKGRPSRFTVEYSAMVYKPRN